MCANDRIGEKKNDVLPILTKVAEVTDMIFIFTRD